MIKLLKYLTIFILALLYIIIGIRHFTNPEFFKIIMPTYIPFHDFFIYSSGFFEILFGGMILLKKFRRVGALGIFFLLILVFPANIYLYHSSNAQEILSITKMDALIRLPFQIPLLILAYWHSKDFNSRFFNIFCLIIFVPTIIYFLTL